MTRPYDFHNVCSLVKWFAKLRYLDLIVGVLGIRCFQNETSMFLL